MAWTSGRFRRRKVKACLNSRVRHALEKRTTRPWITFEQTFIVESGIKVPTFVDLLQRCCDDPGRHLGEETSSHFDAYHFGYYVSGPLRAMKSVPPGFAEAVENDFSTGSLSSYSFNHSGFLVAALGEPAALHQRLNYLKRLCTPLETLDEFAHTGDLFRLLGKDGSIRQRPRMFLGNEASSMLLWSLISGSRWAEIDSGTPDGPVSHFSIGFQAWIEKKHPFSRRIPWGRTLFLLSVNSAEHSVGAFFSYYDSYTQNLRRKRTASP